MLLVGSLLAKGAKALKSPAVRKAITKGAGAAIGKVKKAGQAIGRAASKSSKAASSAQRSTQPAAKAAQQANRSGGLLRKVQQAGIGIKKNFVDAVEGFTKPIELIITGTTAWGLVDAAKGSLSPSRDESNQSQPSLSTPPKQTQPSQNQPSATPPKQTQPSQNQPPATPPKQTQPSPNQPPATPPKPTQPNQPHPVPKQVTSPPPAPIPAPEQPAKVQPSPPKHSEQSEVQPIINIVIDKVIINGDPQFSFNEYHPVRELLQQQAQQDLIEPASAPQSSDRTALLPPQSEFTTLEELRIHAPTEYIDAVIARNAQALVEKQGMETEQGKIYETDNFTISVDKGTYTISEPQGETLMQFRYPEANSEIPQILFKGEMSHELHLELLAARPSLELLQEPTSVQASEITESERLANAATAAEVAFTVLDTPEALRLANGSRIYEGSAYRFEQQANNLTISAIDGRGEIFKIADGDLQFSALSKADVERFNLAATRLYQAELEESVSQAPLPASNQSDLER